MSAFLKVQFQHT